MPCRLASRHRRNFMTSRISGRHLTLGSHQHDRLHGRRSNYRTDTALLDDLVECGRHSVDERLRIKPHDEYHGYQGEHYGDLAPVKISKFLVLRVVELSKHHALEHPEHINCGKDNAA